MQKCSIFYRINEIYNETELEVAKKNKNILNKKLINIKKRDETSKKLQSSGNN